jgi:hypothetical protein
MLKSRLKIFLNLVLSLSASSAINPTPQTSLLPASRHFLLSCSSLPGLPFSSSLPIQFLLKIQYIKPFLGFFPLSSDMKIPSLSELIVYKFLVCDVGLGCYLLAIIIYFCHLTCHFELFLT